MKKVTLLLGVIVVAQSWSMADTIGWWRMDSVGGVLPVTLTNSVNPGVLDATGFLQWQYRAAGLHECCARKSVDLGGVAVRPESLFSRIYEFALFIRGRDYSQR